MKAKTLIVLGVVAAFVLAAIVAVAALLWVSFLDSIGPKAEARKYLTKYGVEFVDLSDDVGYVSSVDLAIENSRKDFNATRIIAGSLYEKSRTIKPFAIYIQDVTFSGRTTTTVLQISVGNDRVSLIDRERWTPHKK